MSRDTSHGLLCQKRKSRWATKGTIVVSGDQAGTQPAWGLKKATDPRIRNGDAKDGRLDGLCTLVPSHPIQSLLSFGAWATGLGRPVFEPTHVNTQITFGQ